MNYFWQGLQQDYHIFVLAPILCAIFRTIFILVYKPYPSFKGKGVALYHCYRYGFWWGMDFNAYVLLLSMIFVTIPGVFNNAWFHIGDSLRLTGLLIYSLFLYTAFVGKMIFYRQFNDTYNKLLWLGRNAEKHNLLDVFFKQYHGAILLLSYLPVGALLYGAITLLLNIPMIPPIFENGTVSYYTFNTCCFIGTILFFYYCRYGGTFNHDDKPEWDEIPSVVKKDIFLSRACIDDLCALENVWHNPLDALLTHTDEDDEPLIDSIMPEKYKNLKWKELSSPIEAFCRTAQGPRIKKPKNIFLIVGESYTQYLLDNPYEQLHIMDGGKKFRKNPHTVSIVNFIPAGPLSRPSIVSLMSGIFDARLELNEREDFWAGATPAALPIQLKKLGYKSIYWYGGNPTYGSFHKFAPAVGFDKVMGATEFCPKDSPKTWVGIYDHIFLEKTTELLKDIDEPTFHYIYTTSNHGPYKMPLKKLGFDAKTVMPNIADKLNKRENKAAGTYWYADKALQNFVDNIIKTYPDSLVIITGDHSSLPIPPATVMERRDFSFRETICTSFAMYHRDFDKSILSGNLIASHMNILPTIVELIAPKGFKYYSLLPSMLTPLDHIVSPYHWINNDNIGKIDELTYQSTNVQTTTMETHTFDGENPYKNESDGFSALTGWLARHPELLQTN